MVVYMYTIFRLLERVKYMYTFNCANCGKEFSTDRKRETKNGNRFCSHTCQLYYSHVAQKEKATKKFICTYCGIEFEAKQSSRKRSKGNCFCSLKCRNDHKSTLRPEILELTCSVCGKTFHRRASIERMNRKKFERICCSRKCASVVNHDMDIYERITTFLSAKLNDKRANVKYPVTITEEDLVNQWKKQGGICPYTGVAMELRPIRGRKASVPYQASLDRIIPELGYVPGNIQFVSLIANYAKHEWTPDVILDFALKVVNNARR